MAMYRSARVHKFDEPPGDTFTNISAVEKTSSCRRPVSPGDWSPASEAYSPRLRSLRLLIAAGLKPFARVLTAQQCKDSRPTPGSRSKSSRQSAKEILTPEHPPHVKLPALRQPRQLPPRLIIRQPDRLRSHVRPSRCLEHGVVVLSPHEGLLAAELKGRRIKQCEPLRGANVRQHRDGHWFTLMPWLIGLHSHAPFCCMRSCIVSNPACRVCR